MMPTDVLDVFGISVADLLAGFKPVDELSNLRIEAGRLRRRLVQQTMRLVRRRRLIELLEVRISEVQTKLSRLESRPPERALPETASPRGLRHLQARLERLCARGEALKARYNRLIEKRRWTGQHLTTLHSRMRALRCPHS
jgi:chromosome segregation ATPase